MIDKVREAGIIGAGGAGFPTHIKFSGEYETIIINGAECEPLLEKDQYIMRNFAPLLAKTAKTLLQQSGAKRVVFALKAKYEDEINALNACLEEGVYLHKLSDYYPAGDEQEIVFSVLGRTVPAGGIPLDVKAVVVNVETLYNIGLALENRPVIEKYLTITGEVKNPCTIKTSIGTKLSDLLKIAGGTTVDKFVVIEGGVMTGKLVTNLDEPVKKTTSGFIVLPMWHPAVTRRLQDISNLVRIASSACTQCRFCTDLCPRYLLGHPLEPHKIMRTTYHTSWGTIQTLNSSFLCSDCGICELYACPMGISPRTIIQRIKKNMVDRGFKSYSKKNVFPLKEKEFRRIPKNMLIERLQLGKFDRKGLPFIETSELSDEYVIPLNQHIGKQATPVVEVGKVVKRGELVAAGGEEGVSANYHSPIDGVIERTDGIVVIRRK